MFIIGLGTALPPRRCTQAECWRALEGWELVRGLAPRSRAILKKVLLGDSGIKARHFALDSVQEAFALDSDAMHERFARHAPALATQAGEAALRSALVVPALRRAQRISVALVLPSHAIEEGASGYRRQGGATAPPKLLSEPTQRCSGVRAQPPDLPRWPLLGITNPRSAASSPLKK